MPVSPFEYALPFLAIGAAYASSVVLRLVGNDRQRRRQEKAAVQERDEIIAGLRLRLPEGAQLVTLEHQMYFYDERNRRAAADVFLANGFEVRSTETHEKRARFWLLATRSGLIERVPDDCNKVIQFAGSFSGRYIRCTPQL